MQNKNTGCAEFFEIIAAMRTGTDEILCRFLLPRNSNCATLATVFVSHRRIVSQKIIIIKKQKIELDVHNCAANFRLCLENDRLYLRQANLYLNRESLTR